MRVKIMSDLEYEIVDVFTDRPFAGNPLAVVFGGEQLDRDQLQALAREFHLSETVFVLPPTVTGATYRARIFTPEAELPFAGHPSVGVAVTQLRRGLFGPGLVHQECGAGVLPITVDDDGRATLTGGSPFVGPPLDPALLLAAVGLSEDDYAGPAPRVASCGLEWTYLPVRAEAVAKAEVPFATGTAGMMSVFAWDAEQRSAHARVFAPGSAVPEDPATGSAALGFGVWLVASGLLPGDGDSSYVIRQGQELHRPSTLDCSVSAVDGQAMTVTVTGSVVPIASGRIAVPPFVG
jgi:trans-2,3-dihydro-3-hydroxyanthranilate isomerase